MRETYPRSTVCRQHACRQPSTVYRQPDAVNMYTVSMHTTNMHTVNLRTGQQPTGSLQHAYLPTAYRQPSTCIPANSLPPAASPQHVYLPAADRRPSSTCHAIRPTGSRHPANMSYNCRITFTRPAPPNLHHTPPVCHGSLNACNQGRSGF